MTEAKKPTVDKGMEVATTAVVDDVVADAEIVPFTDDVSGKEIEAWLSGAQTIETQDPEVVVRGIVARILEADSVAAVFNKQAVVGLRDLTNQPIEIRAVRWGKSTFEESQAGFYAIVDAVNLTTGEVFVGSCGGLQVLAQLFVLSRLKAFPVKVTVDTTPKPTAGGFYPLFLQPVTEPEGDF